MTVTLELKPTLEAVTTAKAEARGVAVENYLQSILEQALPRPAALGPEAIHRQRTAILERLHGKYAGLPGGSEDFAASKEKAREERFWRDTHGTR